MTSLLLAAALVTNSFIGITNMHYGTDAQNSFHYHQLSVGSTAIMTWNANFKTVEVTEAATNMVIHTKLMPYVTKTNDTYYIELIKPDPKLILDPQTKGLRNPDGNYLKAAIENGLHINVFPSPGKLWNGRNVCNEKGEVLYKYDNSGTE